MDPRWLRHGDANHCGVAGGAMVAAEARPTIKTWALPPPMMPAMADTATGLQTSGRRTTKARMGSVLAQACLHLGAVSPLADRHV